MLGRAQRKTIPHQPVVDGQGLRILQLDPGLTPGRDGEDAGLVHPRAQVLQQGRVAHFGYDGFILAPGLLAVQNLAADFLSVHDHAEFADADVVIQGEDVGSLDLPFVGVGEDLGDAGDGHRVHDVSVSGERLDRQWH